MSEVIDRLICEIRQQRADYNQWLLDGCPTSEPEMFEIDNHPGGYVVPPQFIDETLRRLQEDRWGTIEKMRALCEGPNFMTPDQVREYEQLEAILGDLDRRIDIATRTEHKRVHLNRWVRAPWSRIPS